jgi:hypothetical protein
MTVIIHPDLQSLIPPLSPEERVQLEANLLKDGCRDALIVWQEEQILLDGHHRYAVCTQHGLPYHIQELSLPDMDAARLWMIQNQLGRRNLTPNQMSYYRGEQYNLQKKQHGGDRKSEASSSQIEYLKTGDRLAAEHGVSRATIARDADYAAAIETLADVLGPDARQAIRDGDLGLTKPHVILLAALVAAHPEVATQVDAALGSAHPDQALRTLLAAFCAICGKPLSNPASVLRGIGPICAGHGNGTHGSRVGNGVARAPAAPEVLVLGPEGPEGDETVPTTLEQTSTGDYEWYTPREVLALVRAVLGVIDVDPASCALAQADVQATLFYTLADDGLRHPWHGTVFCNPPYKMPEIAHFIGKLCEELDTQRTTEAILLVNSATETDWFQRAFQQANAVCFPDGRLHFGHATRGNDHPCQGQALLYYGPHVERFCTVFAVLGGSTPVRCQPPVSPQRELAEAPALAPPQALPAPPAPDCPAYDTAVYVLGTLCPEQHAYGQTGQTLRRITDRHCLVCDAAKARQQRQKRKQAVGAGA